MGWRGRIDQHFYFFMALLVAAVVIYGFSHTIGDSLIHPASPPPFIFYPHVLVFSCWVLWFIAQTGLIQIKRVALHRQLGWAGVVIGFCVPLLGIATAVVSQQSATSHAFFAISLNDMLLFASSFWLAVYWRRAPQYHKRLMLIATTALTGAAFARFPEVPGIVWAYGCIDLLILVGALRDLIVDGRIHIVFRYAIPAVLAAQSLAIYLALAAPPAWIALLRIIF